MKNVHLLFILLLILALGCKKDDPIPPMGGEGSIEEIENWANEAIIDSLMSLNFVIHQGNTPPNIEGTYYLNPRLLQQTNVPNDWPIGAQFAGIEITLSNQDNSEFVVNFVGVERDGNNTALPGIIVVDNYLENSFITGSGNNFSCFFKVLETKQGETVDLIYAFTGTKTNDGISNIQNALFMLDDRGTATGLFIRTNTGRIFNDGDGLAENY